MGINGLSAWVKKTHPEALQYFSSRWADPRIKGKKIAIDGTLMTNRFHMARMRGYDEELRAKGGVIGWYNLMTAMRAQGVQPIVIWDQRGTRHWKAAEARKRLAARSLALARRNHEEERADRLVQLRSAFDDFEAMDEVEKSIVRSYWETTGSGTSILPKTGSPSEAAKKREVDPSPESSTSTLNQAVTSTAKAAGLTTDLPLEAAGEVVMKAASFIGNLSSLVDDYRASIKPFQPRAKAIPEEVTDAIDHIRELEEFTATVEEKPKIQAEEEEDVAMIDEKIQEIVPKDYFRESPSQTALTVEEGKVIEAFLHSTETDTEVMRDEISGLPITWTAKDRLDEIIEKSPEVKNIYERALSLPTTNDHNDCKELLLKMGVPILEAVAPYEAEGLAASMAKAGLVDFVGTEDSDVLAYEGPLLRNLSAERSPLIYVSGSRLRDLTNLTPDAFLEFCILLGTDASPRIPRVGPMTARRLIDKYGSIDKILATAPGIAERVSNMREFREMVESARRVFSDLPPIPEGVILQQGVWDEREVNLLMEEKHGVRFVEQEEQEVPDEERIEEVEGVERLQEAA